MKKPPIPARIFVLLARDSETAVVIRRGPSKVVQLVRWNTGTDEFEPGQWLMGRVYERRCDLSPSGKYLLYFATKEKGPIPKWTAISKPPYFTALALWKADASTGGGRFESENAIALNQSLFMCGLQAGFSLAPEMTVHPINMPWELSENDLYERRLTREGWQLTQRSKPGPYDEDAQIRYPYDPPEIYTKPLNYMAQTYFLNLITHGVSERNGTWMVTEYNVTDGRGDLVLSLGRADRADWDRSGDLLFAKSGKIFRLRAKSSKHIFHRFSRRWTSLT